MAQRSRTRNNELPETQSTGTSISAEQIAQRAYALYVARGSADGRDLEDWLEAERQLQDEATGMGTTNNQALIARA